MNSRQRKTMSFIAGISAILTLSGCGGSGTFSPAILGSGQPAEVIVTVGPQDQTVFTGDSLQFTATVTGTTNSTVVWSVSTNVGGNPGSISNTGLYTAPNSVPVGRHTKRIGDGDVSAQITITARSVASPSATGSSNVTLELG